MRVICNGTDLSEAFNKVVKAVSAKNNIPILEGIKMMAYGNELKLIGTDSELTIENIIHADIQEEGEAVVTGKFTAELINVMVGKSIDIVCENNNMTFTYEDSVINVKCMNINEYPPIVTISGDNDITMMGADIKELIKKTVYSAAEDEVKPVLKGVLFEIKDNKISFVALDGHRLAIANKNLEGEYKNKKIIIPAKTLKEVLKLVSDDDIVKIRTDDKRITFDKNNTVITSVLIQGEYLSYNNIIPKNFNTTIVAVKSQLQDVLTRVSIIAKNNRSKLLKLEVKEGVLILSSEIEIGDIKEQLPVKQKGNDVILGVNYRYLLDCIDATNEEYIKISLVNSVDPIIIENLDMDNYLCLILPIRISF